MAETNTTRCAESSPHISPTCKDKGRVQLMLKPPVEQLSFNLKQINLIIKKVESLNIYLFFPPRFHHLYDFK